MTAQRIIHLRINDSDTGQRTPARVRVVGPDGRYLAPLGRLTAFHTAPYRDVGGNLRLGKKQYAYIGGECEIRVPIGKLSVEVHKGPECVPQRHDVHLGVGQLAVGLGNGRWCDLRRDGWYAGDGRAHALTPHAALLEAAAEDLAVVNLLALEQRPPDAPPSIPNILAFSGQQPALQWPGHCVVVNTLNRHPTQGQVALLNCHRVVYPLALEASEGFENWSLGDWCAQCHRKGGLTVWIDSGSSDLNPPVDLFRGHIDALEVCHLDGSACPTAISKWYQLLTAGLHVPLVGSSGKDSNAVALGAVRTYAHLRPNETFSYGAWIEAVRAGRTFITSGPLLQLTVNGQEPGATIERGDEPLRLWARARCWDPVERLEILVNGLGVAQASSAETPATATVEAEVPSSQARWLACRCWGRTAEGDWTFAHTSAVYVEVPDGGGRGLDGGGRG
ncbi:MAG TPA: CehA/McbA family metallohydrolase [Gemmataceae bacterium]|nr:CehA/McbA family metallohydrolase [Gemmataceae bacterium]